MGDYFEYAFHVESQRMVCIDEVPTGLECGCICPKCKQPLVARNRDFDDRKRKPYFAHHDKNAKCEGAKMTVLHKLAQQIIKESKAVMLPEYRGRFYRRLAEKKTFVDVQLEESFDKSRPDCIGKFIGDNNKEQFLWIEIYVTHKVDEEKKEKIKKNNVSCIEIDLSDMIDTDYSIEKITKRLQEDKNNREWINNPEYNDRDEELSRQRISQRKIVDPEKEFFEKLVEKWYEKADSELARSFIDTINNQDKKQNGLRFKLYEVLVPNHDYLYYVERSPKNEDGLRLLYTLLRYFFNHITSIDYTIIEKRLNEYKNRQTALAFEEKIDLEQLLSLQIIYILEMKRIKLFCKDNIYRSLIDKYLLESTIRKSVLGEISMHKLHSDWMFPYSDNNTIDESVEIILKVFYEFISHSTAFSKKIDESDSSLTASRQTVLVFPKD